MYYFPIMKFYSLPTLCFVSQEIDYDGFKIFMDKFLEIDAPKQLCQHLFLSFVRIPQEGNDEDQVKGNSFKPPK